MELRAKKKLCVVRVGVNGGRWRRQAEKLRRGGKLKEVAKLL